jgi:glutamate/tyrosine decarboxylase-like PLP-dependent enzyme
VSSISALARADSVTIDPHKLGYVPYPAGALLLQDKRSRELVSLEPPYLMPTENAGVVEERFLGRWILEGSKPGAAAAAVWLSHRVVPLDERGYGLLIAKTIDGAHKLHEELASDTLPPFATVRFPLPDLNIVNWVMTHPTLTDLASLNAFNERIYVALSPSAGDPPYFITRTRLTSPSHDGAVEGLMDPLGIGRDEWQREGLVVLRVTVMDPFFGENTPMPDHLHGFIKALRATAERVLIPPATPAR